MVSKSKGFCKGPYHMAIETRYLVGKMFKNISPDSVRSGRTCPAKLGVRSCPVRKLICPVQLSPSGQSHTASLFTKLSASFNFGINLE